MKIAENGRSPYRIVISREASSGTEYAAEELSKYLSRACGARLPVVTDDAPPEECEIVIGRTGRAGSPSAEELRNDGYVLSTSGKKLFLTGENERGDVYAVYGFLERKLGFRFYTASLEKIPSFPVLEIPEIRETVIPPFALPRRSRRPPETVRLDAVINPVSPVFSFSVPSPVFSIAAA